MEKGSQNKKQGTRESTRTIQFGGLGKEIMAFYLGWRSEGNDRGEDSREGDKKKGRGCGKGGSKT